MSTYQKVLLDTSAIVSVFQSKEQFHQACLDILKQIDVPLLTTWPVITEAHYLLRNDREAQEALDAGPIGNGGCLSLARQLR